MTESEVAALARQIAAELDQRRTVDEKTHALHHEFIEQLIKRSDRRERLWQAVKIGLALTGITGIMYGVWNIVIFLWNNLPRGGGHG